jgi:acyl carrier protein
VLGTSVASIDAERPLSELGLDSLMAVELRDRLARETGLALPSTLLYDYPTPDKLAGFLAGAFGSGAAGGVAAFLEELQRFEAQLSGLSLDGSERARLHSRFTALGKRLGIEISGAPAPVLADDLSATDDEALYRLIDQSLAS